MTTRDLTGRLAPLAVEATALNSTPHACHRLSQPPRLHPGLIVRPGHGTAPLADALYRPAFDRWPVVLLTDPPQERTSLATQQAGTPARLEAGRDPVEVLGRRP